MIKTSYLGRLPYLSVQQKMRHLTTHRKQGDCDHIWLLEHDPVYTFGRSQKDPPASLHNIPCIATDRGGKITYHGPNQLIVYLMLDLKHHQIGVRSLVRMIESSIITWLASIGIKNAYALPHAPGVYLKNHRKIASLGLRIHRHFCYHGLSINFACDLAPFQKINPCGIKGMQMTNIVDELPKNKFSDDDKIKLHWSFSKLFCNTLNQHAPSS